MKKHLCTKISYTKVSCAKLCVALLVLFSSFSLAFADNPSETQELRDLKQDYRAFLASQRQATNLIPTEAEEMKLVKQDYLGFLLETRQLASFTPTQAQEMRLVKQDYRAFLLEQHKTATLLVAEPKD